MKLLLSKSELAREWRLRACPEKVVSDYSITRTDGMDIDDILDAQMDDWYRHLLHNADLDLLNPIEISDRCSLTETEDGCGYLTLPAGVLKVVTVEMEGWTGVPTITADRNSRIAKLQQSPYSKGTADSPVAVVSERRIDLYPVSGTLLSVHAIIDLPEIYVLDSASFATIKPI